MQLTRAADYAVRVMIHLAASPLGWRENREALAVAVEVPSQFLSKVLQCLVRAQLIVSHRGSQGGFELARPSAQISMLDVVEAVEGPLCVNVCLGADNACGRRWWCPAHSIWKQAQDDMARTLRGATLDKLARAAAEPTEPLPAEGVVRWN